jgi:hypothetical protein
MNADGHRWKREGTGKGEESKGKRRDLTVTD